MPWVIYKRTVDFKLINKKWIENSDSSLSNLKYSLKIIGCIRNKIR